MKYINLTDYFMYTWPFLKGDMLSQTPPKGMPREQIAK